MTFAFESNKKKHLLTYKKKNTLKRNRKNERTRTNVLIASCYSWGWWWWSLFLEEKAQQPIQTDRWRAQLSRFFSSERNFICKRKKKVFFFNENIFLWM